MQCRPWYRLDFRQQSDPSPRLYRQAHGSCDIQRLLPQYVFTASNIIEFHVVGIPINVVRQAIHSKIRSRSCNIATVVYIILVNCVAPTKFFWDCWGRLQPYRTHHARCPSLCPWFADTSMECQGERSRKCGNLLQNSGPKLVAIDCCDNGRRICFVVRVRSEWSSVCTALVAHNVMNYVLHTKRITCHILIAH